MRRIHLARVEAEPAAFAPLVAAAADLGLRIGWLDWASAEAAPGDPPAPLAAGFAVGGTVAAGATLLAWSRRGPARLRDVLRQGFLGCRLVLVRGELVGVPFLAPEPGGVRLELPGGGSRELDVAAFVASLRRPHPWPQPVPPD